MPSAEDRATDLIDRLAECGRVALTPQPLRSRAFLFPPPSRRRRAGAGVY